MTIFYNGISKSMILLSQEPLSDRLKLASLNTLLGMGITFAVLTLIILIISIFKFLPLLTGERPSKKESKVNSTPVDDTIAQIISREEANLMNDQELVAVITAAITAFESENSYDVLTGGFIVRSIRKINNR
ncbi:MAG: OadG family protein [Clostridiales bacterium]|nr:OadG family protein [Clostridiales bacterium]